MRDMAGCVLPLDSMAKSEPPRKRKARPSQKPYVRTAPRKEAHGPKTSAIKAASTAQSNLTLHDWLTVVTYYDDNAPISQRQLVRHFRELKDGALIFTQSSLSRHLSKEGRAEDLRRLNETSNALSTKKARVVTRPDVEKALVLWVRHMEEKLEHVTGAMLVAKREQYERDMDVPEEERMRSEGWLPKFCKT